MLSRAAPAQRMMPGDPSYAGPLSNLASTPPCPLHPPPFCSGCYYFGGLVYEDSNQKKVYYGGRYDFQPK